MTNQEAIKIAQGLITDFKCESETMVEFCNVVIKALNQMGVLDKIVEEIKQTVAEESTEDFKWSLGLNYSLQIIDKYRKGAEECKW